MKWTDRSKTMFHGVVVCATTAAVIAALVWTVEPRPLLAALGQARPGYLVAALGISLLFYTVQSAEMLRWTLRGFSERVSFGAALEATVGNVAIRAVLPLSSGELTRAAYLHRNHGVGFVRTTIASAATLWIKLGWLLALSSVGWIVRPVGGAWFGAILISATVAVFGGGIAALGLGGRLRPTGGAGIVVRAQAHIRDASSAVRVAPLLVASAHCLAAVAEELGVLWLVLLALDTPVDGVTLLTFVPLCVIGAKLPLTLMGMGTREGMLLVMLSPMGSPAVILGAGLLHSSVQYVVPAVLGAALTGPFVSRLVRGRDRR